MTAPAILNSVSTPGATFVCFVPTSVAGAAVPSAWPVSMPADRFDRLGTGRAAAAVR